jgi:tryptophan aminotransferase
MFTPLLVRAVLHLENSHPGLISMLAGKPHSSTFPITSLSFTYRDPANPGSEVAIQLSQEELDYGLQYSPTSGHPELIEWLYELQKLAHSRDKGENWSLTIGNGAQDLIYKVSLRSVMNRTEPTCFAGCDRSRESW